MITKRSLQNLNALMMLLAVDKYRSKRKVAENINTSIDTINKYLHNLEQNLGVQLVVNSTNGCKLTVCAKNMVEKLQSVTDILDQIYNQRPENNKYRGEVSICIPLIGGIDFFSDKLGAFFEEYPDVKITSLTSVESPKYEESGADLAIVLDFDERSKYYSLVSHKTIEFGLAASKKYLQKYGTPKDMNDLLENHRIASQFGKLGVNREWKEMLGKARYYAFASNSIYAVSEAVRKGLVVGVMPRKTNCDSLVWFDKFNFNCKLNLCLIANNNTKNLPRVKAVSMYYQSLINNI